MKLKTKAIIVDLDGTLCNISHRRKWVDGSMGKKDCWNKFFEGIEDDKLNWWCYFICESVRLTKIAEIIFLTGRPENYEHITRQWLSEHIEPYSYYLYMRKDGDFRQDSIVKEEIYRKHIEKNFEIIFCIDDRQQVVDMWRSKGLVCLQCDVGDF